MRSFKKISTRTIYRCHRHSRYNYETNK